MVEDAAVEVVVEDSELVVVDSSELVVVLASVEGVVDGLAVASGEVCDGRLAVVDAALCLTSRSAGCHRRPAWRAGRRR